MEPSDHLFRREAGRMVATLTRIFGVHNLALAEDVVQDAFCRALEVWKFRGVPENPSAWLMATAKNRALDVLAARAHRAHLRAGTGPLRCRANGRSRRRSKNSSRANAIKDDLLRMMFSCCQPRLSEEAQVALILHILCGFSVGEIADAFVSYARRDREAHHARQESAGGVEEAVRRCSARQDFAARLPAVHRALYLLFNEGYHGASPESAVRAELCREAMRLTAMLLEHPLSSDAGDLRARRADVPARGAPAGPRGCIRQLEFPASIRTDRNGIGSWSPKGSKLLELSATGPELTEYHLEAAIAAIHARAASTDETDWKAIVSLYDMLMGLRPSPIVALNRAIAVAQQEGPERGLEEIRAIRGLDRLSGYPFYSAALGELEFRRGQREIARGHFLSALGVARNDMERRFLTLRVRRCEQNAANENTPSE